MDDKVIPSNVIPDCIAFSASHMIFLQPANRILFSNRKEAMGNIQK
jgi:hypothetical protein